jgi:twitching motility protein PilT
MTIQIKEKNTELKSSKRNGNRGNGKRSIDIEEMLKRMVAIRASDLHLKAPTGPIYRVDGELVKDEFCYPVSSEDVEEVYKKITSSEQREQFDVDKELDFALALPGVARYRINVHKQRGSFSIAFRMIPYYVYSIEELGLPKICVELILKPRGLILVTGPTGSGKSTTLAAMIRYRNENTKSRIITIEDPIEYMFNDENCVISQRELGDDTNSFTGALKHALRHDPDVIVVGEMRDLETISTAIAAAETGHLVLGTLHTIDAAQTVDRLIDMFPAAQQAQMRLQLSQLLVATISQTLLPKASGEGRVGAFEVMTGNTAVKNIIREGRTQELPGTIQLGHGIGMQTLDQDLARLVKNRIVRKEDAILKSSNSERLTKMLTNGYGPK